MLSDQRDSHRCNDNDQKQAYAGWMHGVLCAHSASLIKTWKHNWMERRQQRHWQLAWVYFNCFVSLSCPRSTQTTTTYQRNVNISFLRYKFRPSFTEIIFTLASKRSKERQMCRNISKGHPIISVWLKYWTYHIYEYVWIYSLSVYVFLLFASRRDALKPIALAWNLNACMNGWMDSTNSRTEEKQTSEEARESKTNRCELNLCMVFAREQYFCCCRSPNAVVLATRHFRRLINLMLGANCSLFAI